MRANTLFILLATLFIVSCSREELLNTDIAQESIQIQKEQKGRNNIYESGDEYYDAFEKNDNCSTKPSDISKFSNALALCMYEKTGDDGRDATGHCDLGYFNSYNTNWMVFQSSGKADHRSEVKIPKSFSINNAQQMALEMVIENAPFDAQDDDKYDDDKGLTVAQIHNRHKSGGRPLLRIAAVGNELRYIIAKSYDGGGTITEKITSFSSTDKRYYIQLRFIGDGKTFTIYVKNRKTGDVFDEHFNVDSDEWDWDDAEDDYYFKTGAYAQAKTDSGDDKPRVSLSKLDLALTYDDDNDNDNETETDIYNESNNSNIVVIRKRNALDYALDGGGSNNNIHQWRYNESNDNQKWVEIKRGDYYSYQRLNTNYCIDGSDNGSNGNNVKIYTCQQSNQNQQWKKINMGDGYYRLEKRNASGYSIDGNQKRVNGNTVYGGNGINIHMWGNSNSNHNQQWKFEYE